MSLKTKLLGGFGIMILITVSLTAASMYANISTRLQAELQSEAYVPQIKAAERLSTAVFTSGESFATYLYTFNDADYQEAMGRVNVMNEAYTGLQACFAEYAKHLPMLQAELEPLKRRIADYRKSCEDVYSHASKLPGLYVGMTQSGEKVGELILDYFKHYRALAANETERLDKAALTRRFDRYDSGMDVLTAVGDARRKMYELQASKDPLVQGRLYREARQMMSDIQKGIETMRAGTKLAIWIERCDALLTNIAAWNGFVDNIHNETTAMNRFVEARDQAYGDLMGTAQRLSGDGMASIDRSAARTTRLIRNNEYTASVLTLIALGAGILMALTLTASITRPVKRIIRELRQSYGAVEDSSSRFTQTASSLAEQTASQAATLEETTASLEEMTSVTSRNAEDADQTREITTETIERIQRESDSMRSMAEAMSAINDQADRISSIIKTIEEIAFQTNLLALNAAVEAARAGEAGKGFAVVADEVRNLAGRSAAAAKDTGELIRATVDSVRHGAEVAKNLEAGYGAIREGSESIGELVERIAEATREQADGVNQITTAMTRLDGATQEISRASEESASSAGGLTQQTEGLRGSVVRLVRLVDGKAAAAEMNNGSGAGTGGAPAPAPARAPAMKQLSFSSPSSKSGSMTVSPTDFHDF